MKSYYYNNGKFDKKEIMKNAWRCVRKLDMSLSSALKMSWAIAKDERRKAERKAEREQQLKNMSSAELAESMGLIF